jgi:hypothetical protein
MTAVAGQASGYEIMLRHFTPDTRWKINMGDQGMWSLPMPSPATVSLALSWPSLRV